MIDTILNKIISDNNQLCRMICTSFDKISARILRQAYTTEECCEMLELIQTYRSIECPRLKVNTLIKDLKI